MLNDTRLLQQGVTAGRHVAVFGTDARAVAWHPEVFERDAAVLALDVVGVAELRGPDRDVTPGAGACELQTSK